MANSSFYKNTGTSATLQTSFGVSVEQAQASEAAAAASEAASAVSETNSAASAAAALSSKNTAVASAANALSDAATTNADRIATNADVVSTNADVVQTNLDRIATAADVVSTNADAVQTAADRVQTGSDVTASGASAAAALASENASSSSETNSSNSAAAALGSQNAAAASETAADADAVATAADRVQTGLDVTASASSASAALASQNAASASATASSDSAAASLASQNAASTSQTAAATSATNAANSATASANPWTVISGTTAIEYTAGSVNIEDQPLAFKNSSGSATGRLFGKTHLTSDTLLIEGDNAYASGYFGEVQYPSDLSVKNQMSFHQENGFRRGIIGPDLTDKGLRVRGYSANNTAGILDLKDNVYVKYPDGHVVKQTLFVDPTNVSSGNTSFNFPSNGTNGAGYWAYTFSDHDAPIKKTQDYVLDITMSASARFLENSDDPGWRAYFQYYNNSTTSWTSLTSTDSYHRQRYADRGTANYAYGVVTSSVRLTIDPAVARYNNPSHVNENLLLLRGYIQSAGGTGSDTLSLYYHSLLVTEIANGD